MPDRVIVDQVDFRQALVFPRVVGSVVEALRPASILLGTFALVAMVVVGRGWDAVRGPSVQPAGLLAGPRTVVDQAMAGDMARRVAREALPTERRPQGWDSFTVRMDVEVVRSAVLDRMAEVSDAERSALQRSLDRLEPFRGRGAFASLAAAVSQSMDRLVAGVLTLEFRAAAASLGDLLLVVPAALWREDPLSAIVLGLVFALMLGFFGTASSRMSAVDLAGRSAISPAGCSPSWEHDG